MSRATERRAMRDTLTDYPLMTLPELSRFLSCSQDHARKLLEDGAIPAADIGRGSRREWRIDPLQAAVYLLATQEGQTVAEFWATHGQEGTPERAARFVRRARKVQGDTAA